MVDKIYSKIFCTSYADHGATIVEVNENNIGLKHKTRKPIGFKSLWLNCLDISQII